MNGRSRLKDYKTSGKTDESRRRQRADKAQLQRNTRRENDLARRRGFVEEYEEPEQPAKVVDPVRAKLEEWKKNKEQKIRQEKRMVKPAFKVGAVKHDDNYLYRQPPAGESKKFNPPQNIKPVTAPRSAKRTLRSGTKNVRSPATKLKVPTVAQALHDFSQALKPIPEEEIEPKMNERFEVRRQSRKVDTTEEVESVLNSTFSKDDHDNVNFNEEVIEPFVMSNGNDDLNFVQVSEETEKPHLQESESGESASQSSAAYNARPDPCPEETEMNVAEPPEPNEQRDAQYYRSLYTSTVTTLEQLCDKWMCLKEAGIPDHVLDRVDVAVGYTNLLINQKLQQFGQLVSDHLNVNTQPPIMIKDLEGFWNLVNIQVKDVHSKFADLEALRGNEWEEAQSEVLTRIRKGKAKKKKATAGKGRSNARAFIELARKQMKNDNVPSPKPMSPAVLRVSQMAKNIAVTPPKRNSMGALTPPSTNQQPPKQTEKENAEPVPEIGQCLQAESSIQDLAVKKTVKLAAGDVGTPMRTPRRSRKIFTETPNSAVRRSTRLLKGKDKSSDLIAWNTPSS